MLDRTNTNFNGVSELRSRHWEKFRHYTDIHAAHTYHNQIIERFCQSECSSYETLGDMVPYFRVYNGMPDKRAKCRINPGYTGMPV